jgi:hypothetical protein
MIDCSIDRSAGISIDDASTLHSVACILQFSAEIIAISPRFEVRERNTLRHQLANSAWLHADSLINNAHFSKIDERAGVRTSQTGCLALFSLKAGLTCAITKRAVNLCLNSASGQTPEIGFGRSGRGCFPDLESPPPQARLDQQKGKFDAIAHRGLGGILVERHR